MNRLGLSVVIAALLCSLGGSGCGSGEGDESSGIQIFQRRRPRHQPPPPPPEPVPPPPEPAPPPAPSEGWTEFTPSADTLTVYVSDSDGNDSDNGLTAATAKRTITAGKALLRSGYPDWMLLKAGDTWTGQSLGSWSKSGRSASEPMVVGSYGSGARPRLLTGTDSALAGFNVSAKSHVAFVGLHFKPHTYTGSQETIGVFWLCPTQGVLLEDCFIEGYKDNFVVQANDGPVTNFKIRRCVVADAWSNTSHAQGIYAYGLSGLLIEECVFDHNGWKEGAGGSPATMYNHNTYLEDCSNVTFRGNLFMRPSSIGNKFCSNTTGAFQNVLVENNFYIEGEVALSVCGDGDSDHRFVDVTIRDNVMMGIGRTQPTGRDLAWYLEIQDWDGGTVENNLFLHQSLLSNSFGLKLYGQSERNVTLRTNVVYGLKGNCFEISGSGTKSGILVQDNELQNQVQNGKLIDHTGSFAPLTYQGNKYFTTASASAWFSVSGSNRSYSQWVTASGETGSSSSSLSYPAPSRNEATYMSSLGGTPSLAAFVAEARAQSKLNWRPEFTAAALNTYVRAGFGR